MKHLESCVRTAINTRKRREDYNDDYPMYCEHCEGWGGTITVTDPSMSTIPDLGENSVEVDDCQHCISKGKCPRCNSDYTTDQDAEDCDDECNFCGFELGVTEGKPYPHSCVCEELEETSN